MKEKDMVVLLAVSDRNKEIATFLHSSLHDPRLYPPHILTKKAFDFPIALVRIDQSYVQLQVLHATEDREFKRLTSLPQVQIDASLIIFSVLCPASFEGAHTRWYRQLRNARPGMEILFAGIDANQREERRAIQEVIQSQKARELIQGRLGCKYVQCGGEGVRLVYEQVVRGVLSRKAIKLHSQAELKSCDCQLI